jgi:hypothetical protein
VLLPVALLHFPLHLPDPCNDATQAHQTPPTIPKQNTKKPSSDRITQPFPARPPTKCSTRVP